MLEAEASGKAAETAKERSLDEKELEEIIRMSSPMILSGLIFDRLPSDRSYRL
jgi:hypothetical protein